MDDVHYEMNNLDIFKLFDIKSKIENIEKSIINFFFHASQNETVLFRHCLLIKQVVSIVIMLGVSWLH